MRVTRVRNGLGSARRVGERWAIAVVALALPLTTVAPARAADGPVPARVPAAGLRPGLSLPGGARLRSVSRVGARTIDVTIDSPALAGEGHARILLPPDFGRSPLRRWPVLYLLHGCCDRAPGWTLWTANTDAERQTAGYNALVIMPDGGTHGFYSDWWNGGNGGPPAWETFHLVELRGLLELGLRAGGRRAIAGLSLGGFGALSYTARHPGMFRAAASYSGGTDVRARTGDTLAILGAYGADPHALWGDPVAQEGIWRAHNPDDLVARLRGTPVYLSAGDGRPGPLDPPGTPADPLESWVGPMNARFAEKARAHGVPINTRLYGPGTHNWPYWARELKRSLPLLMDSIGADPVFTNITPARLERTGST